jgi:fructose-1,6-bisphosphatase/inositol monophosphatase family enzyme
VVNGSIDAYLYQTPKLWDLTAFSCIIQEAGGSILNQKGNPWKEGQPLLICVPELTEQLVSVLT